MAGGAPQELHVAIIGAGIAGLALAMNLHNKGVVFTLYEEAKQYSAVGAGIGFGPNGMKALDMIEPGFRPKYDAVAVGNKRSDAQHVFFEGLLMEEGLGLKQSWSSDSTWGHEDYIRKSAHRKDLLDIMTTFIPIDRVRFDKRLTDIEERPDKVVLRFADGQRVDVGLVVGADGIQSLVRKHVLQLLHPKEVEPVYADSYCYRAVIPITEAEDILGDLVDVAKMYMGHGRSCVTYRISGGKELNFLHCVASPDWRRKNAVTDEVPYETMMADFEGHGIDERLLRLLSKAKPVKWGLFHHAHTSTYYRGRVVLMGDSAHASLPFQAAGAGQGVEDALVLGNVLAELVNSSERNRLSGSQVQAALEGYDSVRRSRAQKQLEQAAEVADMIFFRHPETGSDMEKILSKLQEGRLDWLWFHDLHEDVEHVSAIARE